MTNNLTQTIFVAKLQGLELPWVKLYPQMSSVLLENPSDCSAELRVIPTLFTGNILQRKRMDRRTIGQGSITELNWHPSLKEASTGLYALAQNIGACLLRKLACHTTDYTDVCQKV